MLQGSSKEVLILFRSIRFAAAILTCFGLVVACTYQPDEDADASEGAVSSGPSARRSKKDVASDLMDGGVEAGVFSEYPSHQSFTVDGIACSDFRGGGVVWNFEPTRTAWRLHISATCDGNKATLFITGVIDKSYPQTDDSPLGNPGARLKVYGPSKSFDAVSSRPAGSVSITNGPSGLKLTRVKGTGTVMDEKGEAHDISFLADF